MSWKEVGFANLTIYCRCPVASRECGPFGLDFAPDHGPKVTCYAAQFMLRDSGIRSNMCRGSLNIKKPKVVSFSARGLRKSNVLYTAPCRTCPLPTLRPWHQLRWVAEIPTGFDDSWMEWRTRRATSTQMGSCPPKPPWYSKNKTAPLPGSHQDHWDSLKLLEYFLNDFNFQDLLDAVAVTDSNGVAQCLGSK